MMAPLDLLCSAIWAPDPTWLRKGGIPRHAILSRSGYVCAAGISCIQARAVLISCFSACARNSSLSGERAWKCVAAKNSEIFYGQRRFDFPAREHNHHRCLILHTGWWIRAELQHIVPERLHLLHHSRGPLEWHTLTHFSVVKQENVTASGSGSVGFFLSSHFNSLFTKAVYTQLFPIHSQRIWDVAVTWILNLHSVSGRI